MLISYIYRIGLNSITGSVHVSASLNDKTEYDIKKLICSQLQSDLNRCFDVYNIEILGMKQVA